MTGADPYVAKASDDTTLKEKLAELDKIIAGSKFAMLTTRSSSGALHSRAMTPASKAGLNFSFIANRDSGKFDELATDPNVNVSYSDSSTTDWVSVSGRAEIVTDTESVKELWNPAIKSWFGDLGDGKHTGEPSDPRVVIIKVASSEIHYWKKTRTSAGQLYEVAKGALTGETAAPGVLRSINATELELARKLENQ